MKIGKNRIAVLIGREGETKKEIEQKLGVVINLDSQTGDYEVLPKLDAPNYMPLNVYTAQKIVNAIKNDQFPDAKNIPTLPYGG